MKKLFSLLLILSLLLSLAACGAADAKENYAGGYKDPSSDSVEADNDLAERKIIRRVSMDMETRDFDELSDSLSRTVSSVGGYTESANVYSRSGARRATYVFRIPSANLDTFLSSLSTLGNVLSRSENAEDVTLAYVDTESRIRALKAEETALLEMLEKSDNLSDLMSIRSRLTDVRYQLDSYESQLRKYDSLIDYSTVSVSVSEVERLSNIRGGVWTQIGDDFMDNVYAIADGAVAFFIWFVGSLPVLILLGGFATGGFFLIRYVHRRRQAKAIAEAEAFKAAKERAENKE